MARHGSQPERQKRRIITETELSAMKDALIEREDAAQIEFAIAEKDSDFVFFYGIRWKADDLDYEDGEDPWEEGEDE